LAMQQLNCLENIPFHLRTKEICEMIDGNRCYLEYIPREFRTEKLSLDALAMSKEINYQYVPNQYENSVYAKYLISKDLKVDKFITKELSDEEIKKLYEYSIKKELSNIKYIPTEYKTNELIQLTMKLVKWKGEDFKLLKYIPENLITYEICKELLKQNILNFKYIPSKFMSVKLCRKCLAAIDTSDVYEANHEAFDWGDLREKLTNQIVNTLKSLEDKK
jgi:hypothetical protein